MQKGSLLVGLGLWTDIRAIGLCPSVCLPMPPSLRAAILHNLFLSLSLSPITFLAAVTCLAHQIVDLTPVAALRWSANAVRGLLQKTLGVSRSSMAVLESLVEGPDGVDVDAVSSVMLL